MQDCAARHGLNLFGLVDARRFDGCQPCEKRSSSRDPACGTIVALGTGGRAVWNAFTPTGGARRDRGDCDAVDALAYAGALAVAEEFADAGYRPQVVDARDPCLSFAQLFEAAGFGVVSPVSGMPLHPEYGPWVRMRAALLVPGRPFGDVPDASIAASFKPCCTCRDRPCVAACPPAVHDGFGYSDRRRCAEHRHAGGCASGCESRVACPVGREYADGDGEPLHAHSVGLRTMQRWFGLGWWRVVPRRWRGGPRV